MKIVKKCLPPSGVAPTPGPWPPDPVAPVDPDGSETGGSGEGYSRLGPFLWCILHLNQQSLFSGLKNLSVRLVSLFLAAEYPISLFKVRECLPPSGVAPAPGPWPPGPAPPVDPDGSETRDSNEGHS